MLYVSYCRSANFTYSATGAMLSTGACCVVLPGLPLMFIFLLLWGLAKSSSILRRAPREARSRACPHVMEMRTLQKRAHPM